jgi:tape measure domain-containing protein
MLQFVLGFAGAAAVMNAAQKAFSDTVRVDSLEAALRSVSRTEEEFNVNTNFLINLTNRLGLELLDTTQAFKNFYAAGTQAGLTADQTRQIFESAAAASANLKLSQQDTNGVLLAFGQIVSKGKVQAEELRGQIGERIPGAFSIAARAIGVTQQQLDKMLSNGEVIATEFLPKFAAELKKTFGGDSTKNVEGLQASINRLKNRFTELIQDNQAGLTSIFSLLINGAGVLIRLLPLLVAGLALYTAEQIRAYIVTQLTTKGTILYNLALVAQRVYTIAAGIALTAYYGTIALVTGGLTKATAVTTIFSNVLKKIPFGAILTIVGLLAGAVVAFARSVSGSTKALSENALKQLALLEVQKASRNIYGEQIAKINSWVDVMRSATTSADTKKRALEELIKISDKFNGVVENGVINEGKLKDALDATTDAIIAQANAQASAQLTAQQQQKVTNVSVLRQNLEIQNEQAKGKTVFDFKLTDEEKGILKQSDLVSSGAIVGFIGNTATIFADRFDQVKKFLDQKQLQESESFKRYLAIQVKSEKELEDFVKSNATTAVSFEIDIKALSDKLENLNKEISTFQGSKADLQKKIDERKKLQDQLDKLLGNKTTGAGRGSRLTGEQKDAFKDIDALRDKLNATDEQRREKMEIDEETFLDNIYSNNVEAINKKLTLLKGSNAEERKQIAQLNLEKVKLENETNQKIFELRATALRDQLDITVKNAQEQADRIIKDPDVNIPETTRSQAQLDADKIKLDAQVLFNQQMDQLEKDRNSISKKNAEDRARDLRQISATITEDEKKLILSQIEDVKNAGEKLQAEFELAIDRAILLVQADTRLTLAQKNSKIRLLENEREFGVLVRQAAQFKQLEEVFKKAYEAGIVTLAQYEDIVKKLEELQGKIANSPKMQDIGLFKNMRIEFGEDVQSFIVKAFDKLGNDLAGKEIGKKLFGKILSQEEAKAMGAAFASAVSQTFALAQDIMNSYFDAEEARIQRNLEIQLQRIDMDHKQAAARAQTLAETESLEKQTMNRKKQAERDAFNKSKELKKKETKIALATELAGIWSSVWSVGVPWVAIALGVVMSALALARFSMRMDDINSQTYAMGGQPGEEMQKPTIRQRITRGARKAIGFGGERSKVPVRGGEFGGKSHSKGGTDFQFKGKRYNAEVKELAVVRTSDAPKGKKFLVEGDQMQLASAANLIGGGIDFRPGAKIKKFESGGYMGQQLQAPVFTPSNVNNINNVGSNTNEKFDELISKIDDHITETSKRIDRIQVAVSEKDITTTQKDALKKSQINSL